MPENNLDEKRKGRQRGMDGGLALLIVMITLATRMVGTQGDRGDGYQPVMGNFSRQNTRRDTKGHRG
jgi:hypothetical protein